MVPFVPLRFGESSNRIPFFGESITQFPSVKELGWLPVYKESFETYINQAVKGNDIMIRREIIRRNEVVLQTFS